METAAQLRAARALLGLDEAAVARAAALPVAAVRRAEAGEAVPQAAAKLGAALRAAGGEFGEGGVRPPPTRDAAWWAAVEAALAEIDAMPDVDPTFTEASLHGPDGLPA